MAVVVNRAAVAAAVMLAAASSASATVLVATWTGTIYDGYDYSGVFGNIGSLDGDAVVSRYTYNTNIGDITPFDYPGYVGESLQGGSDYALPSPVMATVTINNHTLANSAANDGIETIASIDEQFPGDGDIQSYALKDDSTEFNLLDNLLIGPVFESSVATPLPLTNIASYEGFGQETYVNYLNGAEVYLDWDNDTLEISAAPEPATWLFMSAGLGLLGGVSRARRRGEPRGRMTAPRGRPA